MMKKWLAALLALTFCLSVAVPAASAEGETTEEPTANVETPAPEE